MNGIKKEYSNYRELRKDLKNKIHNLSMDSIGKYNDGNYSTDITIREYDDKWCIDYDIYKLRKDGDNSIYLCGGLVCNVSDMPFREKSFWKLVVNKVTEEMSIMLKNKCF